MKARKLRLFSFSALHSLVPKDEFEDSVPLSKEGDVSVREDEQRRQETGEESAGQRLERL